MTRKGQREGPEKWGSLVGSNQVRTFSKALIESWHGGGDAPSSCARRRKPELHLNSKLLPTITMLLVWNRTHRSPLLSPLTGGHRFEARADHSVHKAEEEAESS